MNLAGFYDESIANGLGWRSVVFVSGCRHNCNGCQNKIAQDFAYGECFTEEKENELVQRIKDNTIVKGLTLCGGEPLCEENVSGLLRFVRKVKQEVKADKPSFNFWCYTGYTMEELLNRGDEQTKELLGEIDVLIDGRYVETKKDPTLKFRGSTNQRIIDVAKYRQEKVIQTLEI